MSDETVRMPDGAVVHLAKLRTTIYAPLFSHDGTPFTPGRVFFHSSTAAAYGAKVITAQPGIEFELMHCPHDSGEWRSFRTGETVAEVQRRRWQDPVR